MVEELKGYKNDSVYYMAAHCNGNGKFMVKTTCEKLPQLETAKPVSISYNKIKYSKRKSKSENKLVPIEWKMSIKETFPPRLKSYLSTCPPSIIDHSVQ